MPRLRASAVSLRKPGTESRCTEMRTASCKMLNARRNWHMPRARDKPPQGCGLGRRVVCAEDHVERHMSRRKQDGQGPQKSYLNRCTAREPLQNPSQQNMLVKIKKLDLSTVPYLTEGSRVLLLTETRYEPVAEAAGSSSAAPPAEAPTVTAKPPSPVSSAAQAKASVAKPPKKAKGSVGAALSGASPAGTASPAARGRGKGRPFTKGHS